MENNRKKLSCAALANFYCAKIYNDSHIRAMDISPDGGYVISCNPKDEINIYDCTNATMRQRPFMSLKYGVDLVRYVNCNDKVIYSSTKVDDNIRCMDLCEKRFTLYLKGHMDRVNSLCVAPKSQTCVASSSNDRTVRLWDLRSCNARTVIDFEATPKVAFDSKGCLMAVITRSTNIELYDLRLYKTPFVTFRHEQERECDWTGLKFSPDNSKLLIYTDGSILRMLNSYNGVLLHNYEGYTNKFNMSIEPCFTPDSSHLLCGSTDGAVHVWNIDLKRKIFDAFRDPNQLGVIQMVQFNPKIMMFAAAGDKMGFWTLNDNFIEEDSQESYNSSNSVGFYETDNSNETSTSEYTEASSSETDESMATLETGEIDSNKSYDSDSSVESIGSKYSFKSDASGKLAKSYRLYKKWKLSQV